MSERIPGFLVFAIGIRRYMVQRALEEGAEQNEDNLLFSAEPSLLEICKRFLREVLHALAIHPVTQEIRAAITGEKGEQLDE